MLVDGIWCDDEDRFMRDGAFHRETSPMPSDLSDGMIEAIRSTPQRFVLVASQSCPWSHGAVLARVLQGLSERLPLQPAGGARIEGYGLLPGPITERHGYRHVHQLYSATDPTYTGRSTVPLLWDVETERCLSNDSVSIMRALDVAGSGPDFRPPDLDADIDALNSRIYDGLSNAVYRAGLAEQQGAYDEAIEIVFSTLDDLEARLSGQAFLFGADLVETDLRLFATLVRFDTVYATHFRCTRKRLVDYPALWRYARRLYQLPGVAQTVDFDEIRKGYYLNDGSHNPHGIVAAQPEIDWMEAVGPSR